MNRRELLMGMTATAIVGVPVLRDPTWTYSAFVKRLAPVVAEHPLLPAGAPIGDLIVGEFYHIFFDGTQWYLNGKAS